MKISLAFSFSNKKSYQQKIGGNEKFIVGNEKMLTEWSQGFKFYLIGILPPYTFRQLSHRFEKHTFE